MIAIAKPIISDEECQAVLGVLQSGVLASGPKVTEFEDQFAEFCESPGAVACSSGTAGLGVAVAALQLEPGSKVLTTPFSFIATGNCILHVGMTPVFADVDVRTGLLSSDAVEAALQADPEIRAVLPVHLYGQPCEIAAITEIAHAHDAYVIEDAAQAHGATEHGRPVGAIGDLGVFSFYATKNMTTGEGGMITGANEGLLDRCRLLVDQGAPERYRHTMLGYNYRMTSIAAAIGLVQLGHLRDWNDARRRNAARLTQAIQALPWLSPPYERPECRHAFHQYVVQTDHRDALQRHLGENGVGTAIHYPRTIPDQPLYVDMGYSSDLLPVSRRLSETVLALPVHPSLTTEELDTVIDAIRHFTPQECALR